MPRFVLVYHGGAQSMNPEEADANRRRCMASMSEVGGADIGTLEVARLIEMPCSV